MGGCLGAVMLDQEQTSLDLPEPQASLWLGLASDNRRLFEGLQDGWLQPLPSRTGSLVGVNAYRREHQKADGNRIPVRIQIDVAKLPNLKVVAFRNNKWQVHGSFAGRSDGRRSVLAGRITSDLCLQSHRLVGRAAGPFVEHRQTHFEHRSAGRKRRQRQCGSDPAACSAPRGRRRARYSCGGRLDTWCHEHGLVGRSADRPLDACSHRELVPPIPRAAEACRRS